MTSRSQLTVCPNCACHAKLQDAQCPCCGERFVGPDGLWRVPAAALVAMGIAAGACGNGSSGGVTSSSSTSVAAGYTVASSISVQASSSSSSGEGGAGGAGGAGGHGGAGGQGGAGQGGKGGAGGH